MFDLQSIFSATIIRFTTFRRNKICGGHFGATNSAQVKLGAGQTRRKSKSAQVRIGAEKKMN